VCGFISNQSPLCIWRTWRATKTEVDASHHHSNCHFHVLGLGQEGASGCQLELSLTFAMHVQVTGFIIWRYESAWWCTTGWVQPWASWGVWSRSSPKDAGWTWAWLSSQHAGGILSPPIVLLCLQVFPLFVFCWTTLFHSD
jgi:hypothetical protein